MNTTHWPIKMICLLLFCLVLFIIYVRFLEYKMAFVPTRQMLSTPQDIGLLYEDVTFKTSDNIELNGWLIKTLPQNPVLIYLHGNAGNIADRLEKIKILHAAGLNIFIIDYRGYGQSQGKPSEGGLYLDARAAYDYIEGRKGLNKEKIIVMGSSLGGAVAVDLALHRGVKALILDSTFTSAVEVAKLIVPWVPSVFLGIKFDVISKIKKINIPTLIIHSKQDEVIPFKHGEALFQASKAVKEFLKVSGGHNDNFLVSRELYLLGLQNFLKKVNLL